jgi:nucleotide-binding universal stress UspA family protein
MRFDRLLVAIDFAPTSVTALHRATAIAAEKATVRLFHAIELDVAGSAAGARQAAESRAVDELKALARPLRQLGLKTEIEVRVGHPATEIVAAAKRASSDLVIVGSQARSFLGREILGSTAEAVAQTSPAPVLVVREQAEGGPYIRRVVVAVDESAPAREAAIAAADLARRLNAPLLAIHAIDLPLAAKLGGTPFPPDDVPRNVVESLGVTVEKDISAALGRPTPVRTVAGDVVAGIARFASADDLLVCGSHGRGALERLAFGSVATGLLRKAPCPVLIVRPPAARIEALTKVQ